MLDGGTRGKGALKDTPSDNAERILLFDNQLNNTQFKPLTAYLVLVKIIVSLHPL